MGLGIGRRPGQPGERGDPVHGADRRGDHPGVERTPPVRERRYADAAFEDAPLPAPERLVVCHDPVGCIATTVIDPLLCRRRDPLPGPAELVGRSVERVAAGRSAVVAGEDDQGVVARPLRSRAVTTRPTASSRWVTAAA